MERPQDLEPEDLSRIGGIRLDEQQRSHVARTRPERGHDAGTGGLCLPLRQPTTLFVELRQQVDVRLARPLAARGGGDPLVDEAAHRDRVAGVDDGRDLTGDPRPPLDRRDRFGCLAGERVGEEDRSQESQDEVRERTVMESGTGNQTRTYPRGAMPKPARCWRTSAMRGAISGSAPDQAVSRTS